MEKKSMPFNHKTVMEQKQEFVLLAQGSGNNFSQLCQRFGISRRTGYKWLDRFKDQGKEGLKEQSKRPHNSPGQIDCKIEQQVIEMRKENPEWGAKKIFALLERAGEPRPARSTINAILKRNGLIKEDKSKDAQKCQRFVHEAPNDLWQMDFKGYFSMLNKERCYPLTILDDHSRFNLGLFSCGDERFITVKAFLSQVFRTYGLPLTILADNGSPWGAKAELTALGNKSVTQLEKWLYQQHIRVVHGRPYHPQTQGKEERFHRTLKAELLQYETFRNHQHAQQRFDWWRNKYNCYRPHEAINFEAPANKYRISSRSYKEQIVQPEYDATVFVRKVSSPGFITFKGQYFKVGKAFIGDQVAIKSTLSEKEYELYYYNQLLRKISLP